MIKQILNWGEGNLIQQNLQKSRIRNCQWSSYLWTCPVHYHHLLRKSSRKKSKSHVYLKMTANVLMILMGWERIKQWQQDSRLDKWCTNFWLYSRGSFNLVFNHQVPNSYQNIMQNCTVIHTIYKNLLDSFQDILILSVQADVGEH